MTPPFCTPSVLTADLETLGYPQVTDPTLLSVDGPSRLSLLTWLAEQIDPTAKFQTADKLAVFWQALGIHSDDPTPSGHRIPFMCPNRPRDRPAALVFLRAAIDLTLAMRRLRTVQPATWAQSHGETGAPSTTSTQLLNDADLEALQQVNALLSLRHSLFPSSVKLLATPTTAKTKRPPARPPRLVPLTNSKIPTPTKRLTHPSAISPQARKLKGPKNPGQLSNQPSNPPPARPAASKIPTREHLLQRLRTLRSELEDFTTKSEHPMPGVETTPLIDVGIIENLVTQTKELTMQARHVNQLYAHSRNIRKHHGNKAVRDKRGESILTTVLPTCLSLFQHTKLILSQTKRVRLAADALRRARATLKALPACTAMRCVILQHDRVENHV